MRFDEDDVIALMEAINAVRPTLWAGRGRELLDKVDGIDAPTTGSHKAGMGISYKGIWGMRR